MTVGVLASGTGQHARGHPRRRYLGRHGRRRPALPGHRHRGRARRASRGRRARKLRCRFRPAGVHASRSSRRCNATASSSWSWPGSGPSSTSPCSTTFDGRVLNTHPALLPSFKGWHAVRDALARRASRSPAAPCTSPRSTSTTGRSSPRRRCPCCPATPRPRCTSASRKSSAALSATIQEMSRRVRPVVPLAVGVRQDRHHRAGRACTSWAGISSRAAAPPARCARRASPSPTSPTSPATRRSSATVS